MSCPSIERLGLGICYAPNWLPEGMFFVMSNVNRRHKALEGCRFYTVEMDNGKQVIVDALKKHATEAMTKAKEFRALAASKATKEESELYLQQAEEEEAKARGYLKHAEILGQVEL